MKKFITFLKLWFGMISECWQDAKIIHDKKSQQEFKKLCEEIDKEDKKSDFLNDDHIINDSLY